MDELDANSLLKAPSCVVSTELQDQCDQESNLFYNAYQVDEHSNKRPLEDGEDFASLKTAKLSDSMEGQETVEAMQVAYSAQADEPDAQDQDEDMEVLPDADKNQLHYQNQMEVQPNSYSPVNQEKQEMVESKQLKPDNWQVEPLPDLPDAQDDNQARQLQVYNQSDSLINSLGREVSLSCLCHCSRADYGSILLVNKNFYSLVRSGLIYQLRRKMGIIEHWVYFSCVILEWEAFDPINGRWMHLPKMVTNECFMFSDKESLAVGTELLVFGKEIESHVTYRYSLLTNTWTSGMKMLTARSLFASASVGEIAIVAGGCDMRGSVLSAAELYNSETGMWAPIPSMNTARKMCSGVFMDGKFYVIGGIGEGNKTLSSGEMYDLETQTWQEIPDMYPPWLRGNARAAATAPPLVAVVKNELFLADHADVMVRKYVKETKKWIALGWLPARADSTNGWGLAFRACGDQLIVIGGRRNINGGMIELNSWVPRDDSPAVWKLLARKPACNFVYNCAVMGC